MEFDSLQKIEKATSFGRKEMVRIGSAPLFIVGIMLFASGIRPEGQTVSIELVIAAMIGGYMAMNIGANDVANAVGPLAAITDAITRHGVSSEAPIPPWVMAIGAVGISLGLALYGPKLIRTVGREITELDQMRAFCISMAAAVTVIIASQLGLPVSSTHIAVGGIFGVGFLREYLKTSYAKTIHTIKLHHTGRDEAEVRAFMEAFKRGSIEDKRRMLSELRQHTAKAELTKQERKKLKKDFKQELVKRSALLKIAAAWVITVPAAGLMAALLFFTIRGIMLP